MATWTKQQRYAKNEAQKRWRAKHLKECLEKEQKYRESHREEQKRYNQNKAKSKEQIHMDKFTYWNERRLDNLIKAGVVVPTESEKQK